MKKSASLTLVVLSAVLLAGCAGHSEPRPAQTSETSSDTSETEVDDGVYRERTDVNTHSIQGDANYLETVTVTLNNGDTIECVMASDELECFEETLVHVER